LKCSVGIQRKSGSGFQPLRRGKMPRPLFEAEPRNLADIVSRTVLYLLLWVTESQRRHQAVQSQVAIRLGVGIPCSMVTVAGENSGAAAGRNQ